MTRCSILREILRVIRCDVTYDKHTSTHTHYALITLLYHTNIVYPVIPTVVARHRIAHRKIGDTIGAFLYIPNMIRSAEFSSSVTSPCQFLGAGPLYPREKNHTAKFSRFSSTIFGACKWTWIRVRWLLRDWRNICCGRYAQIEASANADHNSLIVFRIHYRRRAVAAVGDLLAYIYRVIQNCFLSLKYY